MHRKVTPIPFAHLRAAVLQQPELPESLAAELLDVADGVDVSAEGLAMVDVLARQVEDYDPYAGAGCFGDACSATTIAATLQRLKALPGR